MFSWEFNDQTLSLTGALDKQSSMALWQQRKKIIATKLQILTIDLSEITRIDSAGLATIIALYRESKKHKIGFKLQGASQQTKDLAKVNGVLELLPIKT